MKIRVPPESILIKFISDRYQIDGIPVGIYTGCISVFLSLAIVCAATSFAPSEDSDQPAHSRSLNRIIIGDIFDSQGSDCAGAQADFKLRREHLSEGMFRHTLLLILKT